MTAVINRSTAHAPSPSDAYPARSSLRIPNDTKGEAACLSFIGCGMGGIEMIESFWMIMAIA